MPPGMEILDPVNGREQGSEEKQSEMNWATLVEIEETPDGHDADEDTLGPLLPNQMGSQRGVHLGGESEGGVEKDEETEANRQSAEDAVDYARDPLHSGSPDINFTRYVRSASEA